MTLKQRLTSQKFKHGSMATALTAVFIVAVVLVNVLVGILGERFPSMNLDMTKSADNSLSEEAAEVVDTVDEKTEIIIMMEESTAKSNANYQKVDAISAKMAERNSNITVEYKNPDKEPGMLSEYDGLTSGSVQIVVKDTSITELDCSCTGGLDALAETEPVTVSAKMIFTHNSYNCFFHFSSFVKS